MARRQTAVSIDGASSREWLEADGLGGFASGTVSGERTRRYHGLLLTATTPPTGRMMLVNGVEVWATTPTGRVALSTHIYSPGVRHPDGNSRLVDFTAEPWPTWTWDLGDGRTVVGEVVAVHGAPRVVCTWSLVGPGPVTLEIRTLLSGRDYHALHHENAAFRFDTREEGAALEWQPYVGVPAVRCLTTGTFHADLQWFRQYLYTAERERGLDDVEDLACPGVVRCSLYDGRAVCVFETGPASSGHATDVHAVRDAATAWMAAERRRRKTFTTPLHRAADAYLVRRGAGRTVIAGYPWFTDWGRDTFIALRGLCLATGRLADARDILLEWSDAVDGGMLPNRFPDAGMTPEFNAVDASLWFVVAAGELLDAASGRARLFSRAQRQRLQSAMAAILEGYARGARYRIHLDADGLIAAGEPGQQLTWMDARVGDREITPRIGKPVEIQALWINALRAASAFDDRWAAQVERGTTSFRERFWNADRQMLYDVVDVGHTPGAVDASFRPNQILAVGGLPTPLLAGERARAIVDAVERHLWTPMGLRSLAPGEPGYAGRYEGPPWQRDAVYHQGTVWPWLMGAFIDAWLATRTCAASARGEAERRFLAPLREHLGAAGLGHVSEIADGGAPFTPRGCPFQAWSVGELIRAEQMCQPGGPSGGASPEPRRGPPCRHRTTQPTGRGRDTIAAMSVLFRMYSDLAAWWPLLSPPSEYVEEAADLLPSILAATDERPATLLELGSGGGSLAFHLKAHMRMTLSDRAPEMLAVSRALNPECEHVEGDMRTLALARTFDVVLVHDAIMYATTPDDARAVLCTASRHCRAGGAIVLVPDFVAETFEPDENSGGCEAPDGRSLRYVERKRNPDPSHQTYETAYDFVLTQADGTAVAVHEMHRNGLFSRTQWHTWLNDAGFDVTSRIDPWRRVVFVGRKRPMPEAPTQSSRP